MKKTIILMMLLMPFALMAQYLKGVITLNNEETIKAYIEVPAGNKDELKYRLTEKGDKEKLSIDDVKSFEITNKDNEQVIYHALYVSFPKFLKPSKFTISDKKHWVWLMKEGKINLYQLLVVENNFRAVSYTYSYYIADETDKYARFLFMPMADSFNRKKYKYNNLDYYLKMYYGEKCPEFVKKVTIDDLEKYGIGRIVDLYDEFCGN